METEIKKVKFEGGHTVKAMYTQTIITKEGEEEIRDSADYEVTKRVMPHDDFKAAMESLKPHALCISEMIDHVKAVDEQILSKVEVTGISIGGHDEHEGVTIIAQRKLKHNRVLNIITPFVKFQDEHCPYAFSDELFACVNNVLYEAEQYLIHGKKQPSPQLEIAFEEGN